ncbi:MAG: hypothetical protein JNK02_01990 [Planctomycetes bacterium]|nr:hypothetical protein [Planctomycetota bacterium]
MNLSRTLLALALVPALFACAGQSYQRVPRPDEGAAVRSDATRIYVGRREQVAGSWRNVRVFDNDREIGLLHENEYLCWDRPARQGVARFIYEGLGFDQEAVEGFAELPAEAGGTVFLGITVERDTRHPTVVRIDEDEGRRALAKRKPAPVGD